MIPLAWWALGFLFADSVPAFPAGNLAPLTRAIAALWRRLDRPVRSPTPQGPKGSVQGPGMPPPAASGDTMYKGCLVSNPSMGCQCCDSAWRYSRATKRDSLVSLMKHIVHMFLVIRRYSRLYIIILISILVVIKCFLCVCFVLNPYRLVTNHGYCQLMKL